MGKFFSASPAGLSGGIALVRIITGVLLLYHGRECFNAEKMEMYTGWFSDRHYTQPALWAYTGKLAELLSGAGLVLGLFTRLAALGVIAAFTGIIFLLGDKGKIFEGDQHPFLFILLSLVFLFTGPGFPSFDSRIFKNKGNRN
ncbi:MAG: DoxX family protein [Sphingobacteriales bacterium]|nr:DoxX family protein [Sphingobacteriales bacterium]